MSIEFRCKDPVIARFCDTRFRRQFERDLGRAQSRGGMEEVERVWHRRLTKEAARQQWYDWVDLDEDQTNWQGKVIGKKRQLVLDEDGKPLLLIPEVVIQEDGGDTEVASG